MLPLQKILLHCAHHSPRLALFQGPARLSLAVREFHTARDERAGPGNEATPHPLPHLFNLLGIQVLVMVAFETAFALSDH